MTSEGVFLAVTILTVSAASPTVPNYTKRYKEPSEPEIYIEEVPELKDLKDLRDQLDIWHIPVFRSLYFIEVVNYSTSKKMAKMKIRMKKADSVYTLNKMILAYLKKYEKHLEDLMNFNLITAVDVLEDTLKKRRFYLDDLMKKLNPVIYELSASVNKETEPSIEKEGAKKLLQFQNHGGLTYMKDYDLYFLNHFREFLDYSSSELKRKIIFDRHRKQSI